METMKDYATDAELMKGIRRGDSRAYACLYKRFAPRLKSFALAFVSDDSTADDILQDCFVNLWLKREQLTAISLSALLFTMVRNRCLNHLKRLSRLPVDNVDDTERGWESLYALDMYGDADRPLLAEELRQAIAASLEPLPERTRQIFEMSRKQGMKSREIATQLGISMTAVENHINKALAQVARYIKARYPETVYAMIMVWLIMK